MPAWPSNPEWPRLEELNGGNEFTSDSGVTDDILNKIVLALIYLYLNR